MIKITTCTSGIESQGISQSRVFHMLSLMLKSTQIANFNINMIKILLIIKYKMQYESRKRFETKCKTLDSLWYDASKPMLDQHLTNKR